MALTPPAAGTLQLNSLTLGDFSKKEQAVTDVVLDLPWSGQYFPSLPLTLEAEPASGYRFSHWEGNNLTEDQAKSPRLQLSPQSDIQVRAVMVKEVRG